jgi:nanoRNase/pAp phosphatase (c-di-AMP/oligoRNAs hydrolase)
MNLIRATDSLIWIFLRPLRISAELRVETALYAEIRRDTQRYAEIRRDTQRKFALPKFAW